jgi:mono/diheme cytochrome c family protein
MPNLTLAGSSELADFHSFLTYIRHPLMPDGSKGVMPAFPVKKISDQEAGQLYQYLFKVLTVRSKKEGPRLVSLRGFGTLPV